MQVPGIDPTPRVLLTRERLAHKWSQRELAELIGTTYVNVSRWERGLTRPSPYFRQKLCVLFGKSEQELDLSPPRASRTANPAPHSVPSPASLPKNIQDDDTPEIILRQEFQHAPTAPLYDPLIPRRSTLELVGRDAELEQLRHRLCGGQNVALTALDGLPGVGKTALSIALVQDQEIRKHFHDGILWAGLGPEPQLSSMLSRWGGLLDVQMTEIASNEERAKAIRVALGTRRMLIVIDDAWTLKDALLFKVGGPDCAHLITTRFPGMATQLAPGNALNIQELGVEDSMKLLSALAPEVVQEEGKKAQDLITAVGGLPLALTLVGNYLSTQGRGGQRRRINTALDRLSSAQERLKLSQLQDTNEGHSSLTPDTHLSLQSVISVTDRQLDEEARHALYALSVFPAKPYSFSETAALYVANCRVETLDTLSDTGLLESGGNERYMLHQTIADYARLQLEDVEGTYERFISYVTVALERHEKDYDLLERDNHIVFAMLDLAREHNKQDYLIRAVLAFTPYLLSRGLYPQAKEWLERAHEAALQRDDTAPITRALLYLGRIAQKQGEYKQAEAYFQDGLMQAHQAEDAELTSTLLNDLGWIAIKQGEYTRAETYLQEGLTLAQHINNQARISSLLEMLGSVAGNRGEYEQSEVYLQESLTIARQVGDREHICTLLINLGVTSGEQAHYSIAVQYFSEALELARKIGHREWISLLLNNLGEAEYELGNYAKAQEHFQEGLSLAREIGHREWVSALLSNLGRATSEQGNYFQAENYLYEGLALARQINRYQITANALYEYGNLYIKQRKIEFAEHLFSEMLTLISESDHDLIALGQYGLARVAASRGNIHEAQRLGRKSQFVLSQIGHRKDQEVQNWLVSISRENEKV